MTKNVIHTFIERNLVTETHEHVTLDGPVKSDHVLREDYVAVVLDEEGRVLISRICANADEANSFLRSDGCREVCRSWHGDDHEIVHEDVAKPSAALRKAAKLRGVKK